MLDAFKIKPFDLGPILETWSDGPKFNGNPKKDLPVEDWLEKIKAGCIERNIPEEYWYKVAHHFMGPSAKARWDELKKVVVQVNGGKYRWTWKKFRIAVINMGWSIDKDQKETIKLQRRSSGLWFMRKKSDEKETTNAVEVDSSDPPPPPPSRSSSFWVSKKVSEEPVTEVAVISRPPPKRSATETSFWPVRRNSKAGRDGSPQRPGHQKAHSDSVVTTAARGKSPPRRSNTVDQEAVVTTITQAPVWLLNACTALEYITSEHPKAMSIISAILITAGSIPAIPAISAGAGGAILASGAAHAIGAIAIGLGQALNVASKNGQGQLDGSQGHGSSSSHH